MLIFAGLEGDSQPERSAKLAALQKEYKESDPRPWNMLGPADMATSNSNRGQNLVVNSHGNIAKFAGMTPEEFFNNLKAKGFGPGSFGSVYLMACQIGKQAQDNSILDNFAKKLRVILNQNGITSKLYTPRGTLSYRVHEETKSSQTYYVVDEMYIKCPERNYPLSEGILLVA